MAKPIGALGRCIIFGSQSTAGQGDERSTVGPTDRPRLAVQIRFMALCGSASPVRCDPD